MHCCICYGCQGVLVIMLFKQLIEDNWDQFTKIVDNIFLLMMRFICASILHLSLLDETYTAMQCMKFAVNHDYLFYDFKLAFISSFFQTTIVIGVESVNIALICQGQDPLTVVLNFIALAVIAEFDNFLYNSLRNEPMKQLTETEVCSKILVVQHKTSKRCKVHELSTVKDEKGNFRPLKVFFSKRSLSNKIFYIQYKCLRIFMASLYFYFFPFLVIFISIMMPLIYRTNGETGGLPQ